MKLILLLLITLSESQLSLSQGLYKEFAKSIGLIEFIDASTGRTYFGTGSLIIKTNPKNNSEKAFLVTNRHVLPMFSQSASISFQLQNSKSKNKAFYSWTIPVFKRGGLYDSFVKISVQTDVAIIEIENRLSQSQADSIEGISYDLLLTREGVKNVDIEIGNSVFYMGYPSLFYDGRNISPILRSGYISTNPSEDFYFNRQYIENVKLMTGEIVPEKYDGFLIDGNVLHGSSGSLVFYNPSQVFIDSANNQYSRPLPAYILGILTNAFPDIHNNLSANIGGVISAEYIRNAIDLFR